MGLIRIIFICMIFSNTYSHNHSDGSFWGDFTESIKNDYIHGCAYNGMDIKVMCVSIKYNDGSQYDLAIQQCLKSLRPYITSDGTIEGCL